MSSAQYLDGKLECVSCGMILLDIPKNATDLSPIQCAKCSAFLGTWGEIQDEFLRELGKGVFEANHGRLRRIE